ncbi:MAG TPA: hypothetical protein VGG30_11345 [Pirellulales bacterium]
MGSKNMSPTGGKVPLPVPAAAGCIESSLQDLNFRSNSLRQQEPKFRRDHPAMDSIALGETNGAVAGFDASVI